MATTTLSIESVGYSAASAGYGFTTTTIVRGSRVPAIEKAVAAFDKAHAADADLKRKLEAARTTVQRFDEIAQMEASSAGATGRKFDAAEVRTRKVAAVQALEDLELEAVASSSFLTSVRSDYMTALRENLEALRKAARDEAADCAVRLTTALELTNGTAERLGAVVTLLAGAGELANGMQPTLTAPRTSADNINDGGFPNVLASVAAGEIERSLGWLSRWTARADEEAEARKVEAKKAKAEAEVGGVA